jgi:hypothetical protein
MEESMKTKHVLMSTIAVIGLAACSSQQDTGSGYSGTGSGGGVMSSFYPGGASTVVHQQTADLFNYQDVAIDSGGKPIPVVVGGGGSMAHPSLTAGVAQEIQGGSWGAPLHFVPASGRELARANLDTDREKIASPYSVVMLFDAPRDVTGAQLCAEPSIADAPAASAAAGGGTTLLSALCRYDKSVSETTARVASVRGPDDPAIGDLVNASVRELTTPMSIESSDTIKYDD